MRHHAFVIEAEAESGIARARAWAEEHLGLPLTAHPDVAILHYGLFSVADARRVLELALAAPAAGDTKLLVIAADRLYHEAQNALLKLFEEPPPGVHLFLILPNLGGLLPTVRSRVQELSADATARSVPDELTHDFLTSAPTKRSTLVKKLLSGKDEEARSKHRAEALALIQGIETAVRAQSDFAKHTELLAELATFRGYMHDRSAPTKLILEHLALVVPAHLV